VITGRCGETESQTPELLAVENKIYNKWSRWLSASAALTATLVTNLAVAIVVAGWSTTVFASNTKPIIYLTFDDGPSSDGVTDALLQLLEHHNARATFFVTGARVKFNPEKIARIIDGGHAIGNHTTNHSLLTNLLDHEVMYEFNTTTDRVIDAGGSYLNCFRAPFGATNLRVEQIASQLGLKSIGWDIDTRDWDSHAGIDEILLQLDDVYSRSVVLMHDGPGSRWKTLEALTVWMDDMAQNFEFRALPQCEQGYERYAALQSSVQLQTQSSVVSSEQQQMKVDEVTLPAASYKHVIPQDIPALVEKLRGYKFSLHSELVGDL